MKKDIETLDYTNKIETLEPSLPKKNNNFKIVIIVVVIICLITFVGMKNIFQEEKQEEIPNNKTTPNDEINDSENEKIDESKYSYKYYKCSTDSKENFYNNIKYTYYEAYSFLVRINDNNITPSTVRSYVTFDNEIDYNNFKKDNSMYKEDESGVLSLVYDTKVTLFNDNKNFDNNYISLIQSKNYICENPTYVPDGNGREEKAILDQLLK